MVRIILYIWQLPQNLLGWILLITAGDRASKEESTGIIYYAVEQEWFPWFTGVSLGRYIIIRPWHGEKTLRHEYGHQRQSLFLGPLYLIIIGLPSIIGNLVYRKWPFDYYRQPWEAWADRLGGVERLNLENSNK